MKIAKVNELLRFVSGAETSHKVIACIDYEAYKQLC